MAVEILNIKAAYYDRTATNKSVLEKAEQVLNQRKGVSKKYIKVRRF